jgi:hypothetical protein
MTNGTSAEAEIEIDFISDPANQSLHDLGDKIHGQQIPFDPDAECARYSWAIDPTNSSRLMCMDLVTARYRAGPLTDDTRWVVDWLRENADDAEPAEIIKTARECIEQVRALCPDKAFVFVVTDRENGQRCVAAVVDGRQSGPHFPTINGSDMWAIQGVCNWLLGVTKADVDAIMRSAGFGDGERVHWN